MITKRISVTVINNAGTIIPIGASPNAAPHRNVVTAASKGLLANACRIVETTEDIKKRFLSWRLSHIEPLK